MGENNFEQTLENYLAVRDRTPNPTIVAALQMAVSGSVPESKLTEALAERDAIGKDLERQVDLNHAQLEEIERLRQLVGELSDDLAAEINDAMPELRPEECLQKILDVLGVTDLNINSRGLLEGYIRNTRPEAQQTTGFSDPVGWQVWNPLVKAWTHFYENGPKIEQLKNDGYVLRPVYAALAAEKQPVAQKAEGAGEASTLDKIQEEYVAAICTTSPDFDGRIENGARRMFALLKSRGHLAPDLASVKEALETSRKRIEYLGIWAGERRDQGNTHFFKLIDDALADLGLYAKSVEGK